MSVYATDLKAGLLGVDAALLAERGPVSPDVAAALAAGVRDRLGATYGLGITGVAGPDPQDGRPPGTVYVALAGPGGGEPSGWPSPVTAPRSARPRCEAALALLRTRWSPAGTERHDYSVSLRVQAGVHGYGGEVR